MNTKHTPTPGPWGIRKNGNSDKFYIEQRIALPFGLIGNIYGRDTATLVSASPDMLDALQAVASLQVHESLSDVLAKVQAAIAKATGGGQ